LSLDAAGPGAAVASALDEPPAQRVGKFFQGFHDP
jgi:hypothetical protein